MNDLSSRVCRYVDEHSGRLVELARDLVRIPSENTPPHGQEKACQEHIAKVLTGYGWQPELYELETVPGLVQHELFAPGRDYSDRPNLGARLKGAGSGRSLLLSGHIDTVPRGTQAWTRDPFGGEVEGNRLYGRGSNDMKGGVATNLFVVEALRALGIRLAGDLLFETVVDEEFGGVNGTLAGRLKGYNADGAVISEPSFLRVCAAQSGGRTAHLTFRAAETGILNGALAAPGVIEGLSYFLKKVPEFAAKRKEKAPRHPLYSQSKNPVPVTITKVFTSPWGTGEPITIPEECKVEMYWQLMPGERQKEVEQEFFEWLRGISAEAPHSLPKLPEVEFPIRWLPGSALKSEEPLVTELAGCAKMVLGSEPPVAGIEGPCDMFVFHQAFGTAAVLWGARGGNTHGADEYVEIDSLIAAAKALILFVCQWCGAGEN